ncbi:hypothetical protein GPECTOR_4g957 [Gonium pectorale]|uniref:FAD/NAD(P)-binding domain-containing protein n=1 Tax=Gonium pectorale TaxID=33097 RepID=A0A150GYJ9_GONPE|nr:hypothetical protein GPECTOR_4g957 [Gonium pectorale]|eukprot:KXZ54885.1 hypothetical protein GPECTOR_4g957 [Gonium pectorale]
MQRLGLGRALGEWAAPSGLFGGARNRGHATAAQASASAAPSGPAFTSASGRPPRVVVLGGGFGGLYAAVRLEQLMWPRGKKPQVTLVDQADRFTFKPLLYELINGGADEQEVAPPFAQLLAPYAVQFVQAQVTSVQPAAGTGAADAGAALGDASHDDDGAAGHVALADGSRLPYDYLLLALGSAPDDRGVPGVRQWAVPFASIEDAQRVKGTLDLLADSGTPGSVVVVGGGYAGVELAAVLAERLRRAGGAPGGVVLRLLTPGSDILEGSPAGQREAARKVLSELGVDVLTGARVRELGPPSSDPASASSTALPTACTVSYSMATGSDPADAAPLSLPADLVVWTAGSSPATAPREARAGFPFPANARGAVITEPTLRVSGSERVFALGDVAVAAAGGPSYADASAAAGAAAGHSEQAGAPLPATAQVAFQQADYAAWNVWAAINGRQLLPFRYQHLGSMMSLGALNAAVALPLPVPAPLGDAVRSSPLGPLLSAAGVRLGGDGATLEGPLAALLRRGAYLYRQPTNEQRLNVATAWLRQGLEAAAALAGGRR